MNHLMSISPVIYILSSVEQLPAAQILTRNGQANRTLILREEKNKHVPASKSSLTSFLPDKHVKAFNGDMRRNILVMFSLI